MAIMISIIRLSFKAFAFLALGSAAFAQTTNFANVAVSGTATVGTVSATSISGGITGSTITSSTLSSPILSGTFGKSGISGTRLFPGPAFYDPDRDNLGSTPDTSAIAHGRGSMVLGGASGIAAADGATIINGYIGDDASVPSSIYGWHGTVIGRSNRIGSRHAGTYLSYSGTSKIMVLGEYTPDALAVTPSPFELEVGQEIRLFDGTKVIVGGIASISGTNVTLTGTGTFTESNTNTNSPGGYWVAVSDQMGDDAFVLGYECGAQGNNALAAGIYSWALGPVSIALGDTATTGPNARGAIAMGYLAYTSSTNSVAFGKGAIVEAGSENSIQIGEGTLATGNSDTVQLRDTMRVTSGGLAFYNETGESYTLPLSEPERGRIWFSGDMVKVGRDDSTGTTDLLFDEDKGPVVKSPDGNRWRLSVDNAGTVSATDLDP